MPQLDVSTYSSQLFWLGICFTIFNLAMSFWLMPRLQKSLKLRKEYVKKNNIDTKDILFEVDKIKQEIDHQLALARQSSREAIQKGIQELEEKQKETICKQDQILQERFVSYEKKINEQVDLIREEISPSTDDYVNQLLDKFLVPQSKERKV